MHRIAVAALVLSSLACRSEAPSRTPLLASPALTITAPDAAADTPASTRLPPADPPPRGVAAPEPPPAAPPDPYAAARCGYIEVRLGQEAPVRLHERQRLEVVDPRVAGVARRMHLDADDTRPQARIVSVYLGGDERLDRASRLRLSVPAKHVTGPNGGVEEIEGKDVRVELAELGPPGGHGRGSFRAKVELDGRLVPIVGDFDVCRLPDRDAP
ncbi:MAG: hypothetical protein HY908_33490 [Myxococcales bacterium]|nr:hypothetical protein [Myxococcales bacterium]